MYFFARCFITFLVLQGVLEVAGNPVMHNPGEHKKALPRRLLFDHSIGNGVAECGKYAATPGAICASNACCSEWGFCGTTTEFCGDGCHSNCAQSNDQTGVQLATTQQGYPQTTLPAAQTSDRPDTWPSSSIISHPTAQPTAESSASPSTPLSAQPTPDNPGENVGKVVAGYWEAWNMAKPCGTMKPQEIPVELLTHLIFSFGFVVPETYQIEPMPDTSESLFRQATDGKKKNPNLKGWTHTDPGIYQKVFTDMVSSAANRQTFIKNLLSFLARYDFDGVDLDWEYPGAADRGGRPTDKENFTKLLQEMKLAFQNRCLVTFAAPMSTHLLQNYDLKGASEAVDWINVMAYDIHGSWDETKQALGHTNLSDVKKGLEIFLRAGVAPQKLVLGTAFYGRSFKMASKDCTRPGCSFIGNGDKGRCAQSAGTLSYIEINDVIASGTKPVFDEAGSVLHLTWGGDNWVSYDDARTIKIKVQYAYQKGLRGVMSWAVDMDDEQRSLTKALSGR
ncbi:hypothetical protein ETB97_001322 [Aspergillus alliaceus]|uniref:chitinase n=1 Tax=Petromyces alliaceus TaxID=209559 RepID=A0A8H6A0W3_PETAA|nr:hypothetical protein ETB97_001322 [Aspergillus burnettii]